jgi:hypothetical protein
MGALVGFLVWFLLALFLNRATRLSAALNTHARFLLLQASAYAVIGALIGAHL